MKKVFLATTAMLLTLALQAQTTKGSFVLGLHNFSPLLPQSTGLLTPTNALGIAFGTSKSESSFISGESSFATIGLSGSAHYFLIDHFSAGINLNVLYQKEKEKGGADPDEYSATVFMAGPELRYYIPLGTKTKVWINGGGSFGTLTNSFSSDQNEDDPIKLSRFGGGVGLAFFPMENWSVDIGAGYGAFISKSTLVDFDGNTINIKSTNSGMVIDLGFSL